MLDFNQDADNLAAYAQGNIGITDTVDVVLGARWTKDNKSGSFVQTHQQSVWRTAARPEATGLELDDDQFTYRVGLNWNPNRDLLVFGSYSTGYKSGGFNSGGGDVALGQKRLFDKETTDNYEVGAKWTLADGRAHLNGTVFRMDLERFPGPRVRRPELQRHQRGRPAQPGRRARRRLGAARLAVAVRVRSVTSMRNSRSTRTRSCLPYPAQVNPTCTQDLKGATPVYAPEWQGSVGVAVPG